MIIWKELGNSVHKFSYALEISSIQRLMWAWVCTTIYLDMTKYHLTDYATFAGRVQNVTHFGTFVDIGVGTDGLIPQSRLRSTRLQLGDRIEVKVISVDINRCRISLDLIRILWHVTVCKHYCIKTFVEKILELHRMRWEEETVRSIQKSCRSDDMITELPWHIY